ncbi:ribonuclease H-like domain-containing protein [Powellomyces hirtus]|nr:ribonuclease H-like domain-containing protein [Powellomyces hirtus]
MKSPDDNSINEEVEYNNTDPPPPYSRTNLTTTACPRTESDNSLKPVVDSLRQQLEELGLDTPQNVSTEGRENEKQEKQASSLPTPPQYAEESKRRKQPYDFYAVFDVEATCEGEGSFEYPNEIIEFPVILISGATHQPVAEFHAFVKPVVNPTLSPFCTALTGITQATVDAAHSFPIVLQQFERWLRKYSSEKQFENVLFVCDGPWDVRDFIRKQCEHSLLNRPSYLIRFTDLRLLFSTYYPLTWTPDTPRPNLARMLAHFNLTFEGREHSGIDDARNIARIVTAMMTQECVFVWNRECKLTRRRVARSGRVVYAKPGNCSSKAWMDGSSILY